MKIVAIIQARMGSTRLSGKVMKILGDKTVLAHDIMRVKQAKLIDQIVIATTTNQKDAIIAEEASKYGIASFRGSENDVLNRYYLAAMENNADIVVRITSDCPLFDPKILDKMLQFYMEHPYDIVTNAGSDLQFRTYPRGLDTEIFAVSWLEQANRNAVETYQREHVTPYIYENAQKIYYYTNPVDYSKYRWTLDTEEDWQLISEIYKHLYHGSHDFYFSDIIRLVQEHPELHEINKKIEQKKLKA